MIHIDGTWEPGKYLYIEAKDGRRWIRFSGRHPDDAIYYRTEIFLNDERIPPTLPPSTITDAVFSNMYHPRTHGTPLWHFSWITREEAQALLNMAIAQNAMSAP